MATPTFSTISPVVTGGGFCDTRPGVIDRNTGRFGELLLDFCIYSARENRAQVVARIRVAATFLTDIHERIGRGLTEIRASGATKGSTGPANPIFLFRRPVDDEESN